MKFLKISTFIIVLFKLLACTQCHGERAAKGAGAELIDSIADSAKIAQVEPVKPILLTASDIQLERKLLFEKYTLEDEYQYQKTQRSLQWESIRMFIAHLENATAETHSWGLLQNYRNGNRESALVKNYKRNSHRRIADTLGVERWQSVALYSPIDTVVPLRYGRDGWPVRILGSEGSFAKVQSIQMQHNEGEPWLIHQRYLKPLPDTTRFDFLVVVDRKNQNIISLEKANKGHWLVRSINPSTTGVHKPPYAQETPLGIFVIQEKKQRMHFHKDGSTEMGGYAPWASRFTNGAYIHGVPVNLPRTAMIEYSQSLGTTPRSHMCVRNASSHAKFIYDHMPSLRTFVVVIE